MKAKGVAAVCLVAAMGFAAGEKTETATVEEAFGTGGTPTATAPSTGLLRPLGVTVLLIGLAGGLFVILRRYGTKRSILGGRSLSVLETAYLSPKHSVALLKIRNRILVVGMGQDLRTLATFDEPEEVMAFDGEFRRELDDALGENASAAPARTAPRAGAGLEPYRRQISQLRSAVGRWRDRLKGDDTPGDDRRGGTQ